MPGVFGELARVDDCGDPPRIRRACATVPPM